MMATFGGGFVSGAQIAEGAITTAKLADGAITDAKISGTASIALSKLAAVTAGQVLLGDASGVVTGTSLAGDVTVSSSGTTAIGSGVIVDADVSGSAAIAKSKISTSSTWAAADLPGGMWIRLGQSEATGNVASLSVSWTAAAYEYIVILYCMKNSASNNNLWFRYNNDSGASYDWRRGNLAGAYGSATATGAAQMVPFDHYTGEFGVGLAVIRNDSANNKPTIFVGNQGIEDMSVSGGTWNNATDNISRIDMIPSANSLVAGSILTVWGVTI